jgi:hypothetical protein
MLWRSHSTPFHTAQVRTVRRWVKVFPPGPVGPLHGEHVAIERRDRGGDRRHRARLVSELAHGRPPVGLAGLEVRLAGVGIEPVLDSEPQSGGGPAKWGEREEAWQLRARVPCGRGSAPRPQAEQHLGRKALVRTTLGSSGPAGRAGQDGVAEPAPVLEISEGPARRPRSSGERPCAGTRAGEVSPRVEA